MTRDPIAFIDECAAVGVKLSAGVGSDGEAKIHVKSLDSRAVTQRMILTMREGKAEIIASLNARQQAEQLPAVLTPDEDDDHPAYRRRIRAVYYDALAGGLPIERVILHPGTTTADPNAYTMGAFRRLGLAWGIAQSQGMDAYFVATTTDRMGIEAVAAWWEAYNG